VVFKKVTLFGLKLAIALGLLYWLYTQSLLDLSSLAKLRFDAKSTGLLLMAVSLVIGAVALLAFRLIILLDPYGLVISFKRALALSMMGGLFGAVLPGLVAGDVIKAAYLFRDAVGYRSRVVATVIIDRIVGLYALFLLSTVASMVAWITNSFPGSPQVLLVGPCLTLMATTGGLLAFGLTVCDVPILRPVVCRMPEKVQNLMSALVQYWKHPMPLLVAIGLSMLSHALIVVMFILAAMLLRDTLPLYAHFVVDPIAMTLNVVPLTPGGLGVTEGAFSYLFAMMGSSNGSLVALLGRFVQYAVFVTGGSIALVGTRMGLEISSGQSAKFPMG
jgi:hypothetical protein